MTEFFDELMGSVKQMDEIVRTEREVVPDLVKALRAQIALERYASDSKLRMGELMALGFDPKGELSPREFVRGLRTRALENAGVV